MENKMGSSGLVWGISDHEVINDLTLPTEHENADHRHAGMDGRHPGSQDASGNVHVNLDSSSPCWNDVIEKVLELTEAPPPLFSKEDTKDWGNYYISIS
jgi:hypothetical protein